MTIGGSGLRVQRLLVAFAFHDLNSDGKLAK